MFIATANSSQPIPDPLLDRMEQLTLVGEVGVVDNGPYWVRGGIPIESADGSTYEVRARMALCRCGHSRNKPFCDGSHVAARFKDPLPATSALTERPQNS